MHKHESFINVSWKTELWIALIICAKIMFSIQKNVFELQDETNLKKPQPSVQY